MKSIKLKFLCDTYYDGKLLFIKGQVYDVDTALGFAERWIKRGAIEVGSAEDVPVVEESPAPIELEKAEDIAGEVDAAQDSDEFELELTAQEHEEEFGDIQDSSPEEVVNQMNKKENKKAKKSSK
jgi:hypothetical protein